MDEGIRLIVAAVLLVILAGLAERTTYDTRGLRIAAAPASARG